MSLSKNTLINLYRMMVRIRKFEEAAKKLSAEKKIPVRVAAYTGEEAIATGVCAHLTNDDRVTSTHRPLGHGIAKGSDLKGVMAELCAKATGLNKGKAGQYHVADVKAGFVGANGIVGGGTPMTAGYALEAQLRGKGKVAVCFFGEGAANQGVVQETLNLASVWTLPLIFVCENSAPEKAQMLGHFMNFPQINVKDISIRGASYGIPGVTVDGSDVLAVYKAAGEAVNRARKGKGPTLIECKTYQYEGPFSGDNAAKLEAEWKKKDPVLKFKTKLLKMHGLSKEELENVEQEETKNVDEAVKFAVRSSEPSLEEAFTDVFTTWEA